MKCAVRHCKAEAVDLVDFACRNASILSGRPAKEHMRGMVQGQDPKQGTVFHVIKLIVGKLKKMLRNKAVE